MTFVFVGVLKRLLMILLIMPIVINVIPCNKRLKLNTGDHTEISQHVIDTTLNVDVNTDVIMLTAGAVIETRSQSKVKV